jgi:hypothetical protein
LRARINKGRQVFKKGRAKDLKTKLTSTQTPALEKA